MTTTFNENSERPRFIYRANNVNSLAFQIFEYGYVKGDYEPIGDYIVLDTSEKRDLTEKKLMNLMGLMNGKTNTIDLSTEVETKTLYQIKPKDSREKDTQVIFRTHDGHGVSIENALLKIKGGIFDA